MQLYGITMPNINPLQLSYAFKLLASCGAIEITFERAQDIENIQKTLSPFFVIVVKADDPDNLYISGITLKHAKTDRNKGNV